jgi:hypothetical protein
MSHVAECKGAYACTMYYVRWVGINLYNKVFGPTIENDEMACS